MVASSDQDSHGFSRFDGLLGLVHVLDRLFDDVSIGRSVQRRKLRNLWVLDQCFNGVYLSGLVIVQVVVDQRTVAEQVEQILFEFGSAAIRKSFMNTSSWQLSLRTTTYQAG